MSRFDRAIRRVELGPCSCPGTPHGDGDWMELRRAPWGAVLDGREATSFSDGFYTVALATIVEWNLLDDGSDVPVPITAEAIDALDAPTFRKVMAEVGEAMPQGDVLPNASSASSRRSRRESAASPTPTTATP